MSTQIVTPGITDARSEVLAQRASRVLCGGVNSPVRSMSAIDRGPLFIERGSGCEVIDIDGNSYIDYVSSWGPLILGHVNPAIVEAVTKAAHSGTSFGMSTEGEVLLAETISQRVASIGMIRMTSSGTEATMTALRIARAASGRSTVLKFAGCYHGHVDGLLTHAGSGLATVAQPASAGVSSAIAGETVVVEFDDRDAVNEAFRRHEIAAAIVEPIMANSGLITPDAHFLELLREHCTATGALLIFDEVITGFRVSSGGAQEYFGVLPDLTLLGKIVGGGLPAGVVGGSVRWMELLAPVGDVYHAGTLSGNPLAVAAGIATLAQLDEQAYARLAAITSTLAEGLQKAARGLPVQISSVPGLLTVFFSAKPISNYASACECDRDTYAAFARGLLARGVFIPPSQFEAWFPSLALSDEQIAQTLEAAQQTFADLT